MNGFLVLLHPKESCSTNSKRIYTHKSNDTHTHKIHVYCGFINKQSVSKQNLIEIAWYAFWIRFGTMQTECALTSGGGLELNQNQIFVYSSHNNKITHSYAPTNSNMVEAFASRPPYTHSIRRLRYELRWPVMLGRYWLDAAKRPLTKWSHVVHWSSRSMSSTTSDKVREVIGQTYCVFRDI